MNTSGCVSFIIVLMVVGILSSIFVLPFLTIKYQTSSGHHTGYITAVEQNGVIFKTKRAYVKTDTQSSQEDSYCVIDDAVYEKLTALSSGQKHVTITFVDWFLKGVQNCGGEQAIITNVVED